MGRWPDPLGGASFLQFLLTQRAEGLGGPLFAGMPSSLSLSQLLVGEAVDGCGLSPDLANPSGRCGVEGAAEECTQLLKSHRCFVPLACFYGVLVKVRMALLGIPDGVGSGWSRAAEVKGTCLVWPCFPSKA